MENSANYQIVSCSGASNAGKFADEVARILSTSGYTSMICLAKVAIGDQTLIEKVKTKNSKIIVLDGCPMNCAKKLLSREGITDIVHINTTEFGIVKGKTLFSLEKANEIAEYIKETTK